METVLKMEFVTVMSHVDPTSSGDLMISNVLTSVNTQEKVIVLKMESVTAMFHATQTIFGELMTKHVDMVVQLLE
jgi:hypothetical protein